MINKLEKLQNTNVVHCYYCKRDLLQTDVVYWSADLYGNAFEKREDYLVVCMFCTKEAEQFVEKIKEVRIRAENVIREIGYRFQWHINNVT